jgi:ligand-binding SRPBCC domain-containing protein
MPFNEIRFLPSPSGRGARMETAQLLPAPRERVFAFYSDAFELERLTPPRLRFRLITPRPIEIRPGTRIDYRLHIRGIPIRWQSEIMVWEPPHRFVDEQRRGPYRHWRHEHTFEEVEGGTICRDVVDFSVPGGRLVERILVRPDIRQIFAYRQRVLAELFASDRSSASDQKTV